MTSEIRINGKHPWRAKEQDALEIIVGYLNEALWPWKPGLVTAQVIDPGNLPFRSRVVVIQSDLLIDDIFTTEISEQRMLKDQQGLGHELGPEVARFFLNRMDEPIPDNIILGSD